MIWLALVALVGAIGTLGFLRLRMQPRCPYMGRALSESDYLAMAAKPGWRARQFSVAPGVELRGLLRQPATPDVPWVVYFSGNSADLLRESQQILDALCAGPGWGVAVWAYRGFDSSRGTPDPATLERDCFKAYLELLTEQKVRPNAVHLVGYSLGTCMAAAVAARAYRDPPASLTLLAPMTRLYMGERTQLWLHRYDTSKWLAGIACPTLVIHGTADDTLAIDEARNLARILGPRARLLELPGIGHGELPMSAAAQDATRAFITQHASTGHAGL
jgi:pimeloyl-ACP methyl ester carboxylesterase